MKTDVIISDGGTILPDGRMAGGIMCDGCGQRYGTSEHPAEMLQVQVALRLYFSCNKCWPKMRILFQTGRIK